MSDEDVRKFLRYYWRELVKFAIDYANLNDHEREAVELCGIREMTIEQASECASPQVSVNTMQSRWSNARKRLARAWQGIDWIQTLADTVKE